ncbi:MAG TPA: S8 family serine peptidase [Gaiellaceae bacterium]|nr:S8 family serine peptidase [Gaiellaceae bacterium]
MKKLRLALPAAVAVALVATSSAAAFTPTNTYYTKQWYLAQDQAFDAWPTGPPTLQPVKVALIDSGVDCALPDFANQIAAKKSFVGGDPCMDSQGHGTIVAGEIAGALDAAGVVGLAYRSQLVVAKVVAPDGTIPLQAEADAIRWAVQQGARVINMSFGAVRDPASPALDTYSKVEAQAVAYAVKHKAIVVAAVGNSDEAYATPWPYASWPAALPHVIGVGALSRSGGVPDFSDQDQTYVDLAAPGVGIFSTFPRVLTAAQASCTPQGYTDCAKGDYHSPEGTSFAAPQVSAAAAVLLGLNPALSPSQVTTILERNTDDVGPAAICGGDPCPSGRDKFSGWGSLDVQKAVAALDSGVLPPSDHFEPNDSVSQAYRLTGPRPVAGATLDYWDDPVDVYRVKLARGQRLLARVRSRPTVSVVLRGDAKAPLAHTGPGQALHLAYRVPRTGWYYVELHTVVGAGRYTLRLNESS